MAWYRRTFFAFFHDPVDLPAAGVAAVFFLLVEPGDRVLTRGYAAPVVDYYTRAAGLPRASAVLRLEGQGDVAPVLAPLAT